MKNKKNDKVLIILVMFVIFFFMSWIIEGGMYNQSGFVSTGYVRMGIYDIVAVVFSGFYFAMKDIFYLLVVGGCYGVLQQLKIYRKLVDKVASAIEGKEKLVMALLVIGMAIYVSISKQIFTLFFIAPFIYSLFIRNGYDKLTAISASFGGMFVGYLGMTFGTYGLEELIRTTSVGPKDMLVVKCVILIAGAILYSIFAILHMDKNDECDDSKSDMFEPALLNETKVRKAKRTKVWPIVLIGLCTLVVMMLAYIPWKDSFGINVFSEFYTKLTTGIKVANVPIFGTLFGSNLAGFGEWSDLIFATFPLMIGIILIALFDKFGINDFCKYFGRGMKKISKVAFIYGFAMSIVFLASSFPWQNTFINGLFGNSGFNIFMLLIISFIAHLILGHADYTGSMYGPFLVTRFGTNIACATLIWHLGAAISAIIAPTSYILLTVLTYGDIGYGEWVKYIWKFVLAFVLFVLIALSIVVYV